MKNNDLYEGQIFPIFDPAPNKFLAYSYRKKVHKQGNWHKAIQAHIIRKNKRGSFDLLMQTRSSEVDIGKEKLDQSIAVQVRDIDRSSVKSALKRGLREELGIRKYTSIIVSRENIAISKKYKNMPNILNRELLYFFIIIVDDERSIVKSSSKVMNIQWLSWKKVVNMANSNPISFTRTARFYFEHPIIRRYVEECSMHALQIKSKKKSVREIFKKTFFLNQNIYDHSHTYEFPLAQRRLYGKLFSSSGKKINCKVSRK